MQLFLPYKFFRFNLRSREGSDNFILQMSGGILYFNPRSREGSDVVTGQMQPFTPISIHAPAKGATEGKYNNMAWQMISIHAPAKGATIPCCQAMSSGGIISIHAPAKGATP